MTKRILTLVMASCALSSSIGAVHEMRTPISLLSKLDNINGSFHFPVARVKPVLFETASVNFWSGAYHRTAYDGLCPKRCDSCCSLGESCEAANCSYNFFGDICGCSGSSSSSCGCTSCARDGLCGININYNGCVACPNKKVPLAQLIFGKAVFGGQEAFSPDTDFRKFNYLLTATTIIAPKLDYKEEGVVLGMHAEHQVYDTKWRVGFNAALPIKNIEVTAHYNCDSVTWNGISYIDWPEVFFNQYGVRLCDTEHVVGFGDLETALVLGYDFTDRLYAEVVGEIKDDDIFIGHSIGCQTILRFLNTVSTDQKADRLILVAPWWYLNLSTNEEKLLAEPWLKFDVNMKNIKEKVEKVI